MRPLALFLLTSFAAGCVSTARDNPNDPKSVTPDASRPPAADTGPVQASDAGRADTGTQPGQECMDSLLPCFQKYRAFDAECVNGWCVQDGHRFADQNPDFVFECAGICATNGRQPGLCEYVFAGGRVVRFSCKSVDNPASKNVGGECPNDLGSTDHADGGTNHGVCRIPCTSANEASVCEDSEFQAGPPFQETTYKENCTEEERCSNHQTGPPDQCNEALDLGPYCGPAVSNCDADADNCFAIVQNFQGTKICENNTIITRVAGDASVAGDICVGMTCMPGQEGYCPPGTYCKPPEEGADPAVHTCQAAPFCENDRDCEALNTQCEAFGGHHDRACIRGRDGCDNCEGSGKACLYNHCVQPRPQNDSGSCDEGWKNVTGMCHPPLAHHQGNSCASNDQCPPDPYHNNEPMTCHTDSGQCYQTCNTQQDQTQTCADKWSVMGSLCLEDENLDLNWRCGCTESSHCPSAWLPLCDVQEERCVGCAGDLDCAASETCVGGVCAFSCTRDDQCTDAEVGSVCVNGHCGCHNNGHCNDPGAFFCDQADVCMIAHPPR
jgi:hypothetical protein